MVARDRRELLLAGALSSFGDELALVALAIRVQDLTGDGYAVAALLAAGLVPMVILAPFAGSLVDRTETRRTLELVSVAQAIIAAALAFATALPLIIALVFLLGAGAAIANPAVFALVPVVAGDVGLTRANSSMEAARYVGMVSGPLAAGLLAAGPGTTAAMALNGATFLVIATVAASMRARRPPQTESATRTRGAAAAGFRWIVTDRILLVTVGSLACLVLFAAIDNVAEVFFADEVLGAPGWGYGVLAAAWLAGMIGGVVLVARRLRPSVFAASVFVAAVVGGLAVAGAALSTTIVVAGSLFVVGGLANGVENASMRNLIYHRVPDHLHGRVFAAYIGVVNATQIAALALGGVLLAGVGSRDALLVGGLGTAIVGGLGALAYVGVRRTAPPAAGAVALADRVAEASWGPTGIAP